MVSGNNSERAFSIDMWLDLIFKNQAANGKDKSGQFVNDLLRTEFHRYVGRHTYVSLWCL
jgi:hypothetical protein